LIALALGLLISALAKTQQVAMMAALTVTFLPTLLLSGFVFAHSSMPLPLRLIGRIVPATYYLRVIREIMMKGKAWFPQEGAVMAGMAILLMAMAVKRFQSRLE
jgi:ABC-2 type transport system permease protein